MAAFRCPKCAGSAFTRWAFPHPLVLHWLLNPGLVFNELVLGQRMPAATVFCETCREPKVQRAYIGCAQCDAWHPGALWSGRRGFGHWAGYVCPSCGASIPCLWNVWSFLLLMVTAPLWWIPWRVYRAHWRAWQLDRMRGAAPPDLAARARQVPWIRVGVFAWGLPTGLLVTLFLAWWFPGGYWNSVGFLLWFFPIWIVAGVAFGLMLKWMATRWGAS